MDFLQIGYGKVSLIGYCRRGI